MKRALIIFDSDGVLVDTEELTLRLFQGFLAERGLNLELSALAERYTGRAHADILADLQDRYDLQIGEGDIQRFRQEVFQAYRKDLRAIEGVREVLENLPYPRCVASNAPPEKLQLVLECTGLRRYFGEDDVFSAYEVQTWKPAPGLFLYAAEKMGFAPDQCLVVEDTELGVQAAVAAGMKCLHYLPGGQTSSLGTAYSFAHMSQLPALLKNLVHQN